MRCGFLPLLRACLLHAPTACCGCQASGGWIMCNSCSRRSSACRPARLSSRASLERPCPSSPWFGTSGADGDAQSQGLLSAFFARGGYGSPWGAGQVVLLAQRPVLSGATTARMSHAGVCAALVVGGRYSQRILAGVFLPPPVGVRGCDGPSRPITSFEATAAHLASPQCPFSHSSALR